MNANLYQYFRQRFDSALDRPFLREPDGPVHSYGDIDRRSMALSAGLLSSGCAVGDRIVVQVEKSPDAVALYFACLRAGLVYVPINTAYTPAEVRYFLEDTGATVLVCDPSSQDELKQIADSLSALTLLTLGTKGEGTLADRSTAAEAFQSIVQRSDQDLAAMLYTSGTTGTSKGAMLTHQGLRENGLALHKIWAFEPGDILLHTLPIFHVHGLFVALHCAILNRSEVIFCPRFSSDMVIQQLPYASVFMGVPTHYVRLLDDDRFTSETCAHMRLFTSGSAPMTKPVFEGFRRRTSHTICERYGMTECGIISSNPYHGDRVAGSVGFALPGYELRIMGETGPAAVGETGIVEVRGTQLFVGYWRLPERTAEEMSDDGFFRTGDVGFVDEEGRLTLAGRAGDMIISGGLNVYPREVESVIDGVEGVRESAVVGVPHPDFGEGVVAFVAFDDGIESSQTFPKVISTCDGLLARFKHPKRYITVDELPRNTMGKVQKASLRASSTNLFTRPD